MTRLALVRHGQTDWIVEGRWQGQADPPLNERGREQARQAAVSLRDCKLVALYSSDLRRALETAQIIGAEVRLTPVPEPRLREIDLGAWQGRLSTEIQARYPDAYERWLRSPPTVQPPSGETLTTLAVRVLGAVNEIIASTPQGMVGIVSHELPIAVILCRSLGLGLEHVRDLTIKTGSWIEVVIDGALR